jgi:L-lactate dehydrogenase complex protein LldG
MPERNVTGASEMSRETVLSGIRRALRRGPLPSDQAALLRARLVSHPRHLIPARSLVSQPELVSLFIRHVEREFGTVVRVPDASAVPAAVADYLSQQNLPATFAMAPHPELEAMPWSERPMLQIRIGRAEDTDQVSVQHVFAAIAETGTLMLPSAPERPTTLNLLADTEIAVLRASRVVGPYEDAWDLLRQEGPMPRNVMLVTGPSRSADIEQALELGAHGPRQLHVILIEDDPWARNT